MSIIANETNLLNQSKNSGITSNIYPKIIMRLTSIALKEYSKGKLNEDSLESVYFSLPDENDYSYDGIGLAKKSFEEYFQNKEAGKTRTR